MNYQKSLLFLILILTFSHFYNANLLKSQSKTTPTTILNLPLTSSTTFSQLSKNFKFQYNHDKQSGYSDANPNEKYYSLDSKGLKKSIYAGDNTFSKGNPTFPRSEMRGLDVIKDNLDYTISFDQLISEYPSGKTEYEFAWMQVFGATGPNIMLRYRKGKYQLLATMGGLANLTLPGKISDDIGKWTNWKLDFKLATSGGYIKVYRNRVLIGSMKGNTTGGNNSYFKHGIYSQEMNPIGTMSTYTKNIIITKN